MFASRIFWRIFGCYAVLAVGLVLALGSFLASKMERTVVSAIDQRLHDTAEVLRDQFANSFPKTHSPALQSKFDSLGNRNKTRLTLVADDGTVVADSARHPLEMENHRERPELRQARSSGQGLARRQSTTLRIPMTYYAIRLGPAEAPSGFVRIAVTTRRIDSEVAGVKRLVWSATALVSLVVLAVTWLVLRRILQPIVELTGAAQAITAGNPATQIAIQRSDELGLLAASFNSMSTQLEHRIGQLKQQQRETIENSQLLETVLAAMTEGVIAVDVKHVVLFANEAARRLLDIDSPDIIGKPLWETARVGLLQKVIDATLLESSPQRTSLQIPRTQAVVALGAVRLTGDPCPGAMLVLEDITELRRLEGIRRDFVSNVSHELKTPLTAIQAMSETLLEGGLEDLDHNRGFVERISEQAERLHALILDLLRLARIESEPDELKLAPIQVTDLLTRCVEEHTETARNKGVELSIETNDPLVIIADRNGLQAVFENLIDNAVKYTPRGGHVKVIAGREAEHIRIDVEDSGVGILLEHQQRVFERFYRVDKARSRDVGGTGLGLSIVKHWVAAFGGEIELASKFGQGSTFSVLFPHATGEAEQTRQDSPSIPPAQSLS